MRVIGLLTLAAVLHTAAAFAQKPADPELRNKRALSVAPTRPTNLVQPHQSQPDATSAPKSGSSARDLANIERASAQQMKTTHKSASSKPGPQAVPGTQRQTKSKPIKFSYHAPTAAGKTSAKNPASPPGRSRPATR